MAKVKRDLRFYLQDMHEAISRIETYTTEGKRFFMMDDKTQDAVIRQLSVLGEAAAKIPLPFRKKHQGIPWKNIVGMRNIIIHDYADTDLQTVSEICPSCSNP